MNSYRTNLLQTNTLTEP